MAIPSNTSATIALDMRDVHKSYGADAAIDGVSLSIGRGELLTLLGPSGSGKTTLLMMIAGFVDPDRGELLLEGRRLAEIPAHKRNIGIVFQQYSLFPHMSVADNVAYPLKVRRVAAHERRRLIGDALALVKLTGYEDRRPSQLSGGQQQRVALARAPVFKPPILLMDEPLGALDRKLRAQMQIEIRAIQQQLGITTVYVTHDQEEALAISDRIAVIHNGRLAQVGTPVEMYERPASPFVADFLGESNLLRGDVVATDGSRLTVRTAGGMVLDARDGGRFRAGDRLVVGLRPERILIENGVPGRTGRIEQMIYLGALVRLQLRVADERLVVTVNRHVLAHALSLGAEVPITWKDDAPVLLNAEESGGGGH
jgi:spermidine/putrescine ABC transporter ATP-binding subunit